LSELVDGAGAAGAALGAGALAGAAAVPAELSPALFGDAASLLVSPEPFASGDPDRFALLYRSAYQPPPLKDTAGACSNCSTGPPQ